MTEIAVETEAPAPDPGGGIEAGAADGQPSAAAEPAQPPSSGEPVEPVAAPTWTPDSPDFQDAVAREVELRLEQYAYRQPVEAQQPEQQLPEFDPFDPESVNAYNDAREQRLLGQIRDMLNPVTSTFEQQQEQQLIAEGAQRIDDILADDFARNGEITLPADSGVDVKQLVKQIAPAFMADGLSRYGDSPAGQARAAEQALHQATQTIRQLVSAAEKIGANKNASELGAVAGAPHEPAGAGMGTVVPMPTLSHADHAAQFVERIRAQQNQ